MRVKWQLQTSVSVWCDSVQQQASDRLQTVYVRGEVVLRARTIVCVRVYCVGQEIHTYTATYLLHSFQSSIKADSLAVFIRYQGNHLIHKFHPWLDDTHVLSTINHLYFKRVTF
jgi:hypothetical protein